MFPAARAFVFASLVVQSLGSAEPRPAPPRTAAGAIRWDAWHGDRSEVGKAVERSLSPQEWYARLPFFARILDHDRVRIDGASQQVMDQEIRYARIAGLDYWAFLLYGESNPMDLGLRYYLSSARKRSLRFCLILELAQWSTRETAAKQIERASDLIARPEYELVAGGRPLLYILASEPESQAWGVQQPKAALDLLRSLVRAKGRADPYVVIQDWRPAHASALRAAVNADAISSYSFQRDGKNAPYAQLAREAEQFWEECRNTGSAVVPIVMTGWDRRPRVERPVFWETWQRPGDGIEKFYAAPKPPELVRHLRNALSWVADHPSSATAKTILIYAWNENDEGGWLVPTLQDGSRRVRAVGTVLRRRGTGSFAESRSH